MLELLVAFITFAVAFPVVEERVFYSRIVPTEMEMTTTILINAAIASIAALLTYIFK